MKTLEKDKNLTRRKIAMEKAKEREDEQGSAVVIIPEYRRNPESRTYEEHQSSMPSPDLYEKVGYNDLQTIEEMYEGDDKIKREDKKQTMSNRGSMINSKSKMSMVGHRTP
jgi:hypothetical protein